MSCVIKVERSIAMNALYRVVLIDCEEIRKLLKRNLNNKFIIIGEGATGREAIDLCDYLAPDLLIIDINIPAIEGLHAIKVIRDKNPFIKIIILTKNQQAVNFFYACSIGVQGYLLKSLHPQDWVRYIESIAIGKYEDIADLYQDLFVRLKDNEFENKCLSENFSYKEKQVLLFVTKGLTNKQIADKMGISENTVKTHMKNIYKKIGVTNRAQLASIVTKFLCNNESSGNFYIP